jgi:hypothetical protein
LKPSVSSRSASAAGLDFTAASDMVFSRNLLRRAVDRAMSARL